MFDLFKRTLPEGSPASNGQKKGWSERLTSGLAKSRETFTGVFGSAFGRKPLDDETLDALETALIGADVGMPATVHLLDDLNTRWKRAGGEGDPKAMLKACLLDLLAPLEKPLVVTEARPFVIMLAGVNGAGKTTSIGKLAKHFQAQGLSVLLAAGDTFRAAAREQLTVWGERNAVAVIAQDGGDPGAVMFDAIAAAKARGIDVVLADTAGRLPTQINLMDEIRKVRRVIQKAQPSAPHETLLVLDANTGQNGLAQVTAFDDALALTGLVMTKLDGSAKGGVVAAIAKQHPIPLRFIGVGEGVDDLKPFVAADFVDALVG
ncbi:MAG: signal recognition particle-docking protein FtsY [Aromatoleum sp.]|nr:signal recognition particle-docking protein FtsY [Aromatoleum sp.]